MLEKRKKFTPAMSAEDRDNPFKWLMEKYRARKKQALVTTEVEGSIGTFDKPIKLPVRIEPKVYFANERTFLSWLEASVLLTLLSVYLITARGPSIADRGKILGYVFTPISILFCLYSLLVYLWRADRIRTKYAGHYDDLYGPTVLVLVLVAGLISAFAIMASDF